MGLTPMMQQYFKVKEKCKDCIVFFRLGDFYEMFFEDAEVASKELELVLTGRDCGLEERAPMCGIPYHAAASYITRLVNKGYKIAICEQMEDPSQAKGIVKRDIIKIITPGTYTNSEFLEDNKNNYIMSMFYNKDNNRIGITFADISTGEFTCTDINCDLESILNEVSKFTPSEMLIQEELSDSIINGINERYNILYTIKEKQYFTDNAEDNMKKQFNNVNFQQYNNEIICSGNGLLNYILETQKLILVNINTFDYYKTEGFLNIDINSRSNLELVETIRERTKSGSLLGVLDKTCTSMGGRQLRKWIEQPLFNKIFINKRLDSVEEIINNINLREDLKECLKDIYDIERIIGKVANKGVNAKEMISLRNSLGKIPLLKQILLNCKTELLKDMEQNLDTLDDVFSLLEKSIIENPSLSIKDGNIIKDGFNSTVDELRTAKAHGKEWIASLESKEKDETGIKSLKVGYNKVFGYYIEITKSNLSLIPEGRYIRKQTLANGERFITPELKEMENKILGAEEKLINLEYNLFCEIRDEVEKHIDRMKKSAQIISNIDCLYSFSTVAVQNGYCKPKISENGIIKIVEGRHPVIEKMLPSGEFISNDTHIDNKKDNMILITGPNMAGKSTYMRQVAIITLMAQMGSFVPAKEANISLCDKIFTRIGASDNLAAGKSTFMVEMWEVSNILKNATNNSLIILDEVGRGTSTYDGLSIAWAVIEFICSTVKAKTLFATHYHELTKLEGEIEGVKNYSIAVKKIKDQIVFLRKIIKGGADRSYGIEVAKLAGLPEEVIAKASEILKELEEKSKSNESVTPPIENKIKDSIIQVGFGDIHKDNIINKLSNIDLMNMTPLQAMNELYKLSLDAKATNKE